MAATQRMPPSLDELRSIVAPICIPRGVRRLDVFGSIARGVPHEGSDVDLLVEFSPEANVGLFEMGDLKEELEERLGCPVDLISLGAVEKSRNPVRRREILSNRVTIYAR